MDARILARWHHPADRVPAPVHAARRSGRSRCATGSCRRATTRSWPRRGLVTDRLVAYQEARARGGVGLIVIQVAGVHPTARYTSHELTADDDALHPRLRAARRGRSTPTARRSSASCSTAAARSWTPRTGTLAVALAPERRPDRALPRHAAGDAGAADPRDRRRVRRVGGAPGAGRPRRLRGRRLARLPARRSSSTRGPTCARTSTAATRRDRLRFLREALAAARAATRPGFVVGLRISIGEVTPDGLTEDEALAALAALDADGAMDYVSVVAGTSATLAGSDHIVPPSPWPNGYTAPLAARAKAVVRVPVFVAGRINQPQEAEAILAAGQADACVMTRALICDPELPAKTADGRLDDIRACIGCNQACIGHFHAGYPISCIQFPESGREREFPRVGPPGAERHPPAAVVTRRARDRRRAGRAQGGGRRRRARPPRHARRGRSARRRPGAAGAGAARHARRSAARSPTSLARGRAGGRADRHRRPRRRRLGPRAGARRRHRRHRARSPTGRRWRSWARPSSSDAGTSSGARPSPTGHVVVADFRSRLDRASAWRRCSRGRGHRVTLAVVGHDGRAADPAVRARHDDRHRASGAGRASGRRCGCTAPTRPPCSCRTC